MTHATVIQMRSGKTYVVERSLETVMEELGSSYARSMYAATEWRKYVTLPAGEVQAGANGPGFGVVADTFFNLDNIETIRRAPAKGD